MKQKSGLIVFALAVALFVPSKIHATVSTVDFNNDSCFDQGDLGYFATKLGTTDPITDVDRNARVDVRDIAYLMKTWEPCDLSNTVDFHKLYPYAPSKTLLWSRYNPNGTIANVYKKLTTQVSADGQSFTIKRQIGTTGAELAVCPRIEDTFTWSGANLYYTNTTNFFNTGGSTDMSRTTYAPGFLWGTSSVTKNAEYGTQIPSQFFEIQQSNCGIIKQTLKKSSTYESKSKVSNSYAWSPHTGGATKNVSTLKLDSILYFNKGQNRYLREELHFYKDPQYGYIPIRAVVYERNSGGQAETVLTDERLTAVQ